MKQIKNKILLIIIECYFGFSYLLYRYGVWVYPNQRNIKLLLFVVFLMVAFAFGFIFAEKRLFKKKTCENKIININKYVTALLIIDGIIMIPYCYGRTGKLFPNVIRAWRNLAFAYYESTVAVQNKGICHYFSAFGLVFIISLIILAFYYWEELNNKNKFFSFFEIVFYLMTEICTGHNKSVFFYSVMVFISYVIFLFSERNKKLKVVIIMGCVSFGLIIFSLFYFNSTIKSRNKGTIAEIEKYENEEMLELGAEGFKEKMEENYGYVEKQTWLTQSEIENYNSNKQKLWNINPYYTDGYLCAYVNIDSFLYKITPNKLKFILVNGSFYFTHGWQGVNIGLDIPYTTSMGMGTFFFTRNVMKSISGIDFYNRTYIYKINQLGYPISLKW